MAQLEPGTEFARDFRIVRALASGGMGAVYEAEQVSTGKTRALKVLHANIAGDPKMRQRFEQEARVGARIESDHIVDVVAAGVEEPAGTPWLVMEFLKGCDLAAYLERRGPLPPAEVVEIFRQMGHALAAAHRVGLVHRDLKPENLFLAESRREGSAFTVKVLDFGIAKALADSPGRATQAMGTPFWMAPEQCEDSSLICPATDVWAMGLIGFSLLTGACYWRAARMPDQSLAVLLSEMTIKPLEPPSFRAREIGREALIPPGFDAWFARCVVRPLPQRFQEAGECVAALVQTLAPSLLPAGVATMTPTSGFAPMSAPSQQPSAPPYQPSPTHQSAPPSYQPAPPSYQPAPPSFQPVPVEASWPQGASMPGAQHTMLHAMPQPVPAAPQPSRASTAWVLVAAIGGLLATCAAAALMRYATFRDRAPEVEHGPAQAQAPAPPTQAPMTPIAPAPRSDAPVMRPMGAAVSLHLVGVDSMTPGSNAEAPHSVSMGMQARTPALELCLRQTVAAEGPPEARVFSIELRVSGSRVREAKVVGLASTALRDCAQRALANSAMAHGDGAWRARYAIDE